MIGKLLCRIGIHKFKHNDFTKQFGDETVSLPIRGISGYAYPPHPKLMVKEQWQFRECKRKGCGWGEFRKPNIDREKEGSTKK